MRFLTTALLGVLIPVAVLAADTPPPAGAMKLSAVLAALETRMGDQLAYIDEAEWDDDGYWEVKYYIPTGGKVKVKLDPVTGEPRT